jgi:hypothetical protein
LPAGPVSLSQGFDPGLHSGAWRQKKDLEKPGKSG